MHRITGWSLYTDTAGTAVRFIHKPCGFVIQGDKMDSVRIVNNVIDHVCP